MPVNIGQEGDRTGLTGNYMARPTSVADKLVQGKDGRPNSVRVVFETKPEEGKDAKKVALFVPLGPDAKRILSPFIPNLGTVPTQEAALRDLLAAQMPGTYFLVYASGGSIRGVSLPEGKHRVQLSGLQQFTRRSDGAMRARFFAQGKGFETVTWTVKYPELVCKVGQTPEEDDIGPEDQFAPRQYLFDYLMRFGLDWKKLIAEVTEAYDNGKLFTRLGLDGEEKGFFDDPGDITAELLEAAARHSGSNTWAEVRIVDNEQYGLGPERGEFSYIEFTPVIIEGGGGDSAEFEREKLLFYELWENLTKVVLADDNARFMEGGKLTEGGRAVASGILVPLLNKYPDGILVKKEDGSPAIHMPPDETGWNINALVAANKTAEEIMGLDEGDRFLHVSLTDEGKNLIEWVEASGLKDYWKGSGYTGDETEVL